MGAGVGSRLLRSCIPVGGEVVSDAVPCVRGAILGLEALVCILARVTGASPVVAVDVFSLS